MVDVKISELPVAGSAAGTDQLEANQAGTSRSITVAQVGTALALTGYAPLASPVFTGDPQAPTPATADSDTSVATTAFVKAQGYQTAAQVTTSLGSYLPLAGGTLGGPGNLAVGGTLGVTGITTLSAALNGTTATFSGTVSAPGAQIQMVSTQTGAVATGTTIMPLDDTIPQITEGDQYMTLAITPKSATSKLIIEVTAILSFTVANGTVAVALFQDATANALAATVQSQAVASGLTTISLRHVMTSGTTSATTFRVRGGPASAGTITFNGNASVRLMGGIMASSIVIREVV